MHNVSGKYIIEHNALSVALLLEFFKLHSRECLCGTKNVLSELANFGASFRSRLCVERSCMSQLKMFEYERREYFSILEFCDSHATDTSSLEKRPLRDLAGGNIRTKRKWLYLDWLMLLSTRTCG